eukprot:g24749.t1
MDDLDLPPDRANLFEVIDADGSGTLRVSELVQGLLKVRGELKKSDVVATTLATQTLQQLIMDRVTRKRDSSIGAIWQREGKVVGALLMGSPGPSAEDQQKLRQLAEAQPAAAEADQAFADAGL